MAKCVVLVLVVVVVSIVVVVVGVAVVEGRRFARFVVVVFPVKGDFGTLTATVVVVRLRLAVVEDDMMDTGYAMLCYDIDMLLPCLTNLFVCRCVDGVTDLTPTVISVYVRLTVVALPTNTTRDRAASSHNNNQQSTINNYTHL